MNEVKMFWNIHYYGTDTPDDAETTIKSGTAASRKEAINLALNEAATLLQSDPEYATMTETAIKQQITSSYHTLDTTNPWIQEYQKDTYTLQNGKLFVIETAPDSNIQ